jgi:peroxiredoxin (alkyl hydroperoxide reductase subunit C)
MEKNEQQLPRLGEPVPAFEAMTTRGKISFPADYKGKWVILFSHPADFTPICTSEVLTFGARTAEFRALNCELIGCRSTAATAISHGCVRSVRRSNTGA